MASPCWLSEQPPLAASSLQLASLSPRDHPLEGNESLQKGPLPPQVVLGQQGWEHMLKPAFDSHWVAKPQLHPLTRQLPSTTQGSAAMSARRRSIGRGCAAESSRWPTWSVPPLLQGSAGVADDGARQVAVHQPDLRFEAIFARRQLAWSNLMTRSSMGSGRGGQRFAN